MLKEAVESKLASREVWEFQALVLNKLKVQV